MAGPPPIPGINNANELEIAISKGVLKDPQTIEMARAAYGSPVVVNPLLADAPAPAPVAPPPLMGPPPVEIAPQHIEAPGLLPNVPKASAPPPLQALVAGPPKPAAPPVEIAPQHIQAPAPKPVQPSLNKPAMGGGPAKAPPIDPTKFGYTAHDIAGQEQAVKHMGAMGGFQDQANAADAAQAEEFERIAADTAARIDLKQQEAEKAAARRKTFLSEFNNETNAQIEQFVNAKVDQNQFWNDKGTGGTVLAAIGIALGGFAQGLAAGAGKSIENGGLQMIEQGIARDIELQKAAIARRGAGIEARKGLYTQYLQQFGDEQVAENMAMEAYLRKAKAQIDATAAKTTSEQVKINAAAMREAIDDRIIQFKNGTAARGEHMWNDYQAQQAAKAQAANAAAASELKKRNEAVFKMQGEVATEIAKKSGGVPALLRSPITLPTGQQIPAGSVVVMNKNGQIDMNGTEQVQKIASVNVPMLQPGGTVAYQPTPITKEGYGKASEQIAGATNAISALDQMEAAAKMPGPWTGEKKKLYEQAVANYTTAYGVANGMGALSGADLDIVKATIPDVPTYGVGYLSDAQLAQLANQKKILAGKAASAAQVYGTPETAGPAPLTSVGAPK